MAATIRTDKIGPADGSADFTLPTADGSAKSALITDGSKALSFATGTPSASNFLRGDGTWAAAGGGKILQVLQATKTDTQTTTTAGFVDATGLSVAITPAATSSKILVLATLLCVGTVGSAGAFSRIVRDSTAIAIGDTAGSRTRASAGGYAPDAGDTRHHSTIWLDSPSTTSATTYKVQFTAKDTDTAYVNRTQTDTDSDDYWRGVSTITVMEIGA